MTEPEIADLGALLAEARHEVDRLKAIDDERAARAAADMNRRVKVEDELLRFAAGKRGPITPDEARQMALGLGVPEDFRTHYAGRLAKAEAALADMRRRYEDWKPVSEPPHPIQIESGELLEFYSSEDGGTFWTGQWEERRDAEIWCRILMPNLNDAAVDLLQQHRPTEVAP